MGRLDGVRCAGWIALHLSKQGVRAYCRSAQMKPPYVCDRVDKQGVADDIERSGQMRFQRVGALSTQHRHVTSSHFWRKGSDAPGRRAFRRCLRGERHDLNSVCSRRASVAWTIPFDRPKASLTVALTSTSHLRRPEVRGLVGFSKLCVGLSLPDVHWSRETSCATSFFLFFPRQDGRRHTTHRRPRTFDAKVRARTRM